MNTAARASRILSPLELPSRSPFAGSLAADRPVRVLVVDDENLNRRLVDGYLKRASMVSIEAADGEEAMKILEADDSSVDVILLDLVMPRMDGETTLRTLRSDPRFSRLPVIICSHLSAMDRQERLLELGAADFVAKPWNPRELLARVRNLARLKRGIEQLEDAEEVILSLARAVEAKDEGTFGHCERLSLFSVELGRRLGLDDRSLLALERGGVLHDIGKVGVPDSVLFKAGRLSAAEWDVMRTHPVVGDQMLAPLRSLQDVRPIVLRHHERWDGSGYPDGLKGEEIPLAARILMVVDAYDALRCERPYKPSMPHSAAAALLREECEDGLWDPTLLDIAIAMFAECRPPEEFDW